MNEAAWLSVPNTAGTDARPCSRTNNERNGGQRASLSGWRLHVSAKISAVDFSRLAFTADNAAFHFFCHGFTQLGQQNECRLVGQTQITAASVAVCWRRPRSPADGRRTLSFGVAVMMLN
jgi:hypothetical protein